MKNRLRCFVVFTAALLLPAIFHAQNATADSLTRLLKNAPPDTHRVSLLTNLAWEINEIRTNEADARLQEAIQLAQKLNFPQGEATAWNGLGVVEEIRGDLSKAEQHYRQALRLRRIAGIKKDIGASLNNLGVISEMQGRFDTALSFHRENLAIQQELHDSVRMARALYNIAGAYQEKGIYDEALNNLLEARLILEAHGEQDEIAKIYTQLGHIQYELDRYPQALDWYRQALGLREKLGDPSRLADALSDYGNALDELDNKDSTGTSLLYYTRALEIRQKLDDQPGVASVYTNLGDAHKHLGHYSAALEYLKKAEDICLSLGDEQALMEVYNTMGDVHYRAGRQDIALSYINKYYKIAQDSKDEKYIQGAYKDYAEVYAALGDYPTAYEWRVKYDEYRYRRLNEKLSAEYARKEALFADQKKQEQIEDQKRELRVQEAELASARTRQFALLGGAAALLILAALLFNRNRIRARANRELATKNVAIQQERERADKLLRNILPEKTAEELKKYNSVQPVRYESVTVMFTDFRGFTKIAEVLPPEELISELDNCFRLFDTIIEKYGLEKIKTIGDAYMCAGGLPTSNQTHPVDTVSAALEMLHELHTMMMQKAAEGKPVFEMRVGIHTGPVVAGVVGSHKFAYDIWGDTVNTAARLEQGGEPGKINISETTYQLVRQVFRCTFRGNLGAKNKGEIAMYFVDGRR